MDQTLLIDRVYGAVVQTIAAASPASSPLCTPSPDRAHIPPHNNESSDQAKFLEDDTTHVQAVMRWLLASAQQQADDKVAELEPTAWPAVERLLELAIVNTQTSQAAHLRRCKAAVAMAHILARHPPGASDTSSAPDSSNGSSSTWLQKLLCARPPAAAGSLGRAGGGSGRPAAGGEALLQQQLAQVAAIWVVHAEASRLLAQPAAAAAAAVVTATEDVIVEWAEAQRPLLQGCGSSDDYWALCTLAAGSVLPCLERRRSPLPPSAAAALLALCRDSLAACSLPVGRLDGAGAAARLAHAVLRGSEDVGQLAWRFKELVPQLLAVLDAAAGAAAAPPPTTGVSPPAGVPAAPAARGGTDAALSAVHLLVALCSEQELGAAAWLAAAHGHSHSHSHSHSMNAACAAPGVVQPSAGQSAASSTTGFFGSACRLLSSFLEAGHGPEATQLLQLMLAASAGGGTSAVLSGATPLLLDHRDAALLEESMRLLLLGPDTDGRLLAVSQLLRRAMDSAVMVLAADEEAKDPMPAAGRSHTANDNSDAATALAAAAVPAVARAAVAALGCRRCAALARCGNSADDDPAGCSAGGDDPAATLLWCLQDSLRSGCATPAQLLAPEGGVAAPPSGGAAAASSGGARHAACCCAALRQLFANLGPEHADGDAFTAACETALLLATSACSGREAEAVAARAGSSGLLLALLQLLADRPSACPLTLLEAAAVLVDAVPEPAWQADPALLPGLSSCRPALTAVLQELAGAAGLVAMPPAAATAHGLPLRRRLLALSHSEQQRAADACLCLLANATQQLLRQQQAGEWPPCAWQRQLSLQPPPLLRVLLAYAASQGGCEGLADEEQEAYVRQRRAWAACTLADVAAAAVTGAAVQGAAGDDVGVSGALEVSLPLLRAAAQALHQLASGSGADAAGAAEAGGGRRLSVMLFAGASHAPANLAGLPASDHSSSASLPVYLAQADDDAGSSVVPGGPPDAIATADALVSGPAPAWVRGEVQALEDESALQGVVQLLGALQELMSADDFGAAHVQHDADAIERYRAAADGVVAAALALAACRQRAVAVEAAAAARRRWSARAAPTAAACAAVLAAVLAWGPHAGALPPAAAAADALDAGLPDVPALRALNLLLLMMDPWVMGTAQLPACSRAARLCLGSVLPDLVASLDCAARRAQQPQCLRAASSGSMATPRPAAADATPAAPPVTCDKATARAAQELSDHLMCSIAGFADPSGAAMHGLKVALQEHGRSRSSGSDSVGRQHAVAAIGVLAAAVALLPAAASSGHGPLAGVAGQVAATADSMVPGLLALLEWACSPLVEAGGEAAAEAPAHQPKATSSSATGSVTGCVTGSGSSAGASGRPTLRQLRVQVACLALQLLAGLLEGDGSLPGRLVATRTVLLVATDPGTPTLLARLLGLTAMVEAAAADWDERAEHELLLWPPAALKQLAQPLLQRLPYLVAGALTAASAGSDGAPELAAAVQPPARGAAGAAPPPASTPAAAATAAAAAAAAASVHKALDALLLSELMAGVASGMSAAALQEVVAECAMQVATEAQHLGKLRHLVLQLQEELHKQRQQQAAVAATPFCPAAAGGSNGVHAGGAHAARPSPANNALSPSSRQLPLPAPASGSSASSPAQRSTSAAVAASASPALPTSYRATAGSIRRGSIDPGAAAAAAATAAPAPQNLSYSPFLEPVMDIPWNDSGRTAGGRAMTTSGRIDLVREAQRLGATHVEFEYEPLVGFAGSGAGGGAAAAAGLGSGGQRSGIVELLSTNRQRGSGSFIEVGMDMEAGRERRIKHLYLYRYVYFYS